MDARVTSRFSVEFLLSQITENFLGELFGVSKNSWQGKNLMDETKSYHVFPSKFLSITVPKIFIGNYSVFQKFFGMGRNIWIRRGYQKFHHFLLILLKKIIENTSVFHLNSVSGKTGWMKEGEFTLFRRNFSVSEFRKFTLGTLRCFRNLLAEKQFFWLQGDITFFRRNFVSQKTEKVHWDSSVFKQFLVAKILHGWEMRSSRFSTTIFLYHVFAELHWEPFFVSEDFGQRKKCMDATGISRFSVEVFLSQIIKRFHWELFVVSENLWQWKLSMNASGKITFSRRFSFVSDYRKLSLGTLRCFKKLQAMKQFYGWCKRKSGFPSKFRCITVPKIFIGNSSVFQKFFSMRRSIWIRLGVSQTPSVLCLTLPKEILGNTSVFH